MDDAQDTLGPTARIARDLIRFDTTNWGGGRSNGEREAAEYLEAALSGLGLSTTVHESAERRTSVFTRVSGADPGSMPRSGGQVIGLDEKLIIPTI